MLHLVTGKSGTGKTSYVNKLLAEFAEKNNNKLMIIVPDQSSFETEKTFLELLGPKLCRNILVVGFSRLCDYVLSQTGNISGIPIDDGGRYLIMSMAIEQVQDNLNLYSKQVKSRELIDLMLNAEKEYKKCSITTDFLRRTANDIDDDTLRKKLTETALVCDAFDSILSKSYIDPLDRITTVTKLLVNNKLFQSYTIAVDGFSGFTAQEQNLLEVLMCQCSEMYVTLTLDPLSNGEDDLFFTTQTTAKVLKRIAKRCGIPIAKEVQLLDSKRFSDDELKLLEKGIFRIDYEQCEKAPQNIQIYSAENNYDESKFVAQNIRRLIIENDYTYNDFAVICRSLSAYQGVLNTIFDKYEIPYFMDCPQSISIKPLIKLITSCFDTINTGFERNSVLSILKTNLTDISYDDIAVFENYLLTWNISGKRFLTEFTANPQGFTDFCSEDDKAMLEQIENIRKDIINPLVAFGEAIKNTDGTTITKELYSLLFKLNVPNNLIALSETLEKNNQFELSEEQRRLWDVLMNILDKMAAILQDYAVSPKRYSQLLEMQFSNIDISNIPTYFDRVTVGTADRIRLNGKKAVFVIGANEGDFPHTPVSTGVFTDNERKILKFNKNLPLYECIEELAKQEKYLAYYALTSAAEKLFVSTYFSDLRGNTYAPSIIIKEIYKIFPLIDVCPKNIELIDKLWAEKPAFEEFVALSPYNFNEKLWLKEYFENSPIYAQKIIAIENAKAQKPIKIENTENAQKLFGKELKLSASQIEKYHLCKFEYFCQYGLRAKERKQAQIDALEYGSLMHYILENFLKNKSKEILISISKDEILQQVTEIINQYAAVHFGGTNDKSPRFLYLFEKIKEAAANLLMHICQELAQSEFTPVDFELNIGEDIKPYKINLPNGGAVAIYGSVDRADIMEKDGNAYVRIIDYKTGSKKFNLSDVLYGLNLQMLIYLCAINRNGKEYYNKNIIPSGILYVPAVSPIINADSNTTADDVKKEIDKAYKMNGLVLYDEQVLTAMEKDLDGTYTPICYKKGLPAKETLNSLATLEQLGAIFKRIDYMVMQMAENLHMGSVEAVPAKGAYDACEWCSYNSVCGYRESNKCVNIFSKDKQAVLNELGLSETDFTDESKADIQAEEVIQ